MDRPHNRPRLEILVPASLDDVRCAFEARIRHPACSCEGKFARNHLHVEVASARRHLWSPTLDVTLRETDEGTVLRGRFGPHPNLWTLYVFLYAAAGFVAVVGVSVAMAQLAIGDPLTGLWGLAGASALSLAVWGTAQVGARWGHD
ncbi:MAG: hypothetical protein KC656_31470, partial [Myxococcales bacterium]|nr:hypothetical protein [Myxococcales bacterium]